MFRPKLNQERGLQFQAILRVNGRLSSEYPILVAEKGGIGIHLGDVIGPQDVAGKMFVIVTRIDPNTTIGNALQVDDHTKDAVDLLPSAVRHIVQVRDILVHPAGDDRRATSILRQGVSIRHEGVFLIVTVRYRLLLQVVVIFLCLLLRLAVSTATALAVTVVMRRLNLPSVENSLQRMTAMFEKQSAEQCKLPSNKKLTN